MAASHFHLRPRRSPDPPFSPSSLRRQNLHSSSNFNLNQQHFFPLYPHRSFKTSFSLSVDRSGVDPPPAAVSGTDLRVVFAAGGTGGHIYPAISIADELRAAAPASKILFLGSDSGMERATVPSAGFEFSTVPAAPLARPVFSPRNLFLPFCLVQSLLAALRQLREFRPDIVVGTGGYVAFPVCVAAALSGVKLVVQEQNSAPGIANSILGRFADLIFVGFETCSTYFPSEKCVVSGNPVRASLRQYVSKVAAKAHFFPRAATGGGQVVLVLGGSLGSNAMNIAVLNMYYYMLKKNKNRFVIWQTGVDGFNEMESLVKSHPRLLVVPFFNSMDLAYAAADIVVSRAGAMTCSEILVTGKPAILIPSPTVAEDHQSKNAQMMASIAGSKVLADDELDSSTLGEAINEILGNESLMLEMSEMALKAAKPDASTLIAQDCSTLVSSNFIHIWWEKISRGKEKDGMNEWGDIDFLRANAGWGTLV